MASPVVYPLPLLPERTTSLPMAHVPPRAVIQMITGPMTSGKSTELLRRYDRHIRAAAVSTTHVIPRALLLTHLADTRVFGEKTESVCSLEDGSEDEHEDEDEDGEEVGSGASSVTAQGSSSTTAWSRAGSSSNNNRPHHANPRELARAIGAVCHQLGTHDNIRRVSFGVEHLSTVTPSALATHGIGHVFVDEAQFFPGLAAWCLGMREKGIHVTVAGLNGTWQAKNFGEMSQLLPHLHSLTLLTAVCVECGADAMYSARLLGGTEEVEVGGTDKYAAMCASCFREVDVVSV